MNTIELIDPAKLVDQHKKLSEALSQTEAMMRALGIPIPGRAKNAASTPPKQSVNGTPPNDDVTVKQAISIAIKELGDLTRAQLVIDLPVRFNRAFNSGTIGATLSRMVEDNELESLENPEGGKAQLYRLKSSK